MRFGVSAANIQPTGAGANACIARARHSEAIGFDSVWVHDHVAPTRSVRTAYPYGSGEQASERTPRDYLEVLTMLSALAVATRRVQIGTCVLAAPYRHPAVVAKMGATADRLSGGRCLIGIGDGWQREEFDVLNVPGDHFDHRFAVTTDYVRAIKELWTNTGPSNYQGEHVAFHDIGAYPKPAQRPHPPIILAAGGPRGYTRASRLADGVQFIADTPAELGRRVDELRRACDLDRRDPSEVAVYMMARVELTGRPVDGERRALTGSADQIADDLRQYAVAGLDHLIATFDLDPSRTGQTWEEAAAGFATTFIGRGVPA